MKRTVIRVSMHIDGPWSVGSVNDWQGDVDLPILADLRGGGRSAYLPATSLAGSLRQHLGESAEAWLGPEPEEDNARRVRSPLRILGIVLDGSNAVASATATAIDGRRRAAAAGTRRTAERVEPSGGVTRAWMCATIDRAVTSEELEAFTDWVPFVGRGRSVGLGAGHVDTVEALVLDLDDLHDLEWWMTDRDRWFAGGRSALGVDRLLKHTGTASKPIVKDFEFEVTERVAVGAEGHDDRAPHLGMRAPKPRSVRLGDGNPIVPGTAWKGIFRHRCEHILRSIDCPKDVSDVLITALFGSSAGQQGRRGVLRFREGNFLQPGGSGVVVPVERKHVAIDRFTGGALGGGHFAVMAVERGARVSCTIETEVSLPKAVEDLLMWVVRDLHDGIIGVGGLTSRGYGSVRLVDTAVIDILEAIDVAALTTDASALAALFEGESDD